MKVILFNNIYPTECQPNVGTYVKTIGEVLEEAGAEVQLCVLRPTGHKAWDYLKYYLRLLFVSLSRDTTLYINHFVLLLPLMLRLLVLKRRCIFHWHGEELLTDKFPMKWLRLLARKCFREEDIHLSPSAYYTKMIHVVLGVPYERIKVTPSGGVQTDVFCGERKILQEGDVLHIGYSAALSEHKGINFLYSLLNNIATLESFTGHKVHFHIIDYGPCAAEFRRFVAERRLACVTIHPKYKKEKLPAFYAQVHLLQFLSKRESLGLTVLEAMACNVPVLARDICACPEMVKPRCTGELLPANPATQELIEGIATIVKHYGDYAPREYVVENYDRRCVVEMYREELLN